MTKPNEINTSPLIPDALREALPKDWLSLVDQAARGWGCTGSEIQRLGAGAKVVAAHLTSTTTRAEAELEAATTLQAAQAEIARLTAALEERRDDVGRLTGRLSDVEVQLAKTALACDVAKREYAEERADKKRLVSAAGLEIEHLNAVIDYRGRKIADLLGTAVNTKRREDDLTAEVEYQRARVDELGRRLTAANDQAEHDAAAVLAAEQARSAAERALKELQDQVVGAIASVGPAPRYAVPDEIELGPAGPSHGPFVVEPEGDELQRLRSEIYNLRSELSHRAGQVEGMQAGAEFMKREVARLEAQVAELQGVLDGTLAVGDETVQRENERLRDEVDRHLQERVDSCVDQIYQIAQGHEDHTKKLRAENARLRAELVKARGSK